MPEAVKRLRWIGAAALIAAYAVLVHHANVTGHPTALGAVLAVMPVFGVALALAVNVATRSSGLALLAAGGLASWQWWGVIAQHAGFLFWLQDVGLMLTLLLTFGLTLLPGRKPLCVQFAEMLQGPLDAAHERYASRVTVAWVVFFGAMALVSTLLFFLAPLAVWSVFVNFLVLPLVALMFVLEFLVRRHVLSDAGAGHILDAVQAYMKRTH